MTRFEPRWLELREPADARARAEGAIDTLLRARAAEGPLRILDLGAGTGANLRYLAPRLGGRQQWLLLDRDRRLLDAIPVAIEAWSVRMGYSLRRRTDSMAVEGPGLHCGFQLLELDMVARPAELPIPGHQLITASALLDLVSEPWAEGLVRRCRAAQTGVLFALSYDGRMTFAPALRDDALVLGLVNRHQHTDKGFGPAMGPSASNRTRAILVGHGYAVERCASDWRIEADELGLQTALIEGLAAAATAMAPASEARLTAWCTRRLELVKLGRSRVTVGHQDLLGHLG
jgi:hypothetical protein